MVDGTDYTLVTLCKDTLGLIDTLTERRVDVNSCVRDLCKALKRSNPTSAGIAGADVNVCSSDDDSGDDEGRGENLNTEDEDLGEKGTS